MNERLARPVRMRFAGPGMILAAAAALQLATGCAYTQGFAEATTHPSPDNKSSSKATTGSTSGSSTKVKRRDSRLGSLMYGTSSDAEHAEMALAYLRANEPQLQQDLAFGAGPALDDLAWIAEIRPEHEREFARLMQQSRAELLEAADARQLTPARAAACLSLIGQLIARHPLLNQDREAWLARHIQPAG